MVVLLSGGRDSVCLLDLAVRLAGPVTALHVNYGLRDSADDDEAHCADAVRAAGRRVRGQAAAPPEGNLQAWARDERYAEAARLALAADALVAAGHTATDQVETVLYRLAASPGRRALLGMPERDGRLIRPLLTSTREETAAHCTERGLPWREDPTNASPEFARNRVRNELMPVLRALHPAAEANVLRTLALLRDEAAVLDEVVAAAVDPPDVARLAALPPALARLAVQALADRAGGGSVGARTARDPRASARPAGPRRSISGAACGRSSSTGGCGSTTARPRRRRAAVLPVPGSVAYGGGRADLRGGRATAASTPTRSAPRLDVRPWRAGDRMRPVGLGGRRTLQDLFTDRKVPREDRPAVPVVVAGGEIAWVPGVATGERFVATPATTRRVALRWS